MEESGRLEDWSSWSKHILKELDRLNTNYEKIQKELFEVKEELAVIKNQQTTVGELKQWKKEMDEVVSPTQLNSQLKDLQTEVRSLQSFKTTALTVWLVIQALFALIIAFKDVIWP
jgi:hypothetical protein